MYDTPYAPATNPYDYTSRFEYDSELGSRRWRLVNDLIGVWLIDAHKDLTDAWAAVIDAGAPTELVNRLCAPPVAAAELDDLVARWGRPRERVALTSTWAQQARKRYRRIRQEAAEWTCAVK